jgi:hypothetical protein
MPVTLKEFKFEVKRKEDADHAIEGRLSTFANARVLYPLGEDENSEMLCRYLFAVDVEERPSNTHSTRLFSIQAAVAFPMFGEVVGGVVMTKSPETGIWVLTTHGFTGFFKFSRDQRDHEEERTIPKGALVYVKTGQCGNLMFNNMGHVCISLRDIWMRRELDS